MTESNNSFNNTTVNLLLVIVIIVLVFGVMWFYRSSDQQVVNNPVAEERNANNNAPPSTNLVYDIQADDQVIGPDNAPVTIVEFSDFQCPYCSAFHKTMDEIIQKYPDKVKWVYKHFPLSSIHPNAQAAAEAAECAGEQDKFWEFADLLFANQSNLTQNTFIDLADQTGLDQAVFTQCINEGRYKQKVSQDYNQGLSYGVNGTPGNIINGTLYPGALSVDQMEQIINGY